MRPRFLTRRRLSDAAEIVGNTALGYVIALATQAVVFPLFGFDARPAEHAGIAAIFTGVSLIRNLAVRWAFRRFG